MEFLKSAMRLAVCAALWMPGLLLAQSAPENVAIDAAAPGTPLPHFWEQMFGSGRAILSLRESYRQDIRDVKKVADFQYVRFHGILNDEVGVYGVDLLRCLRGAGRNQNTLPWRLRPACRGRHSQCLPTMLSC